MSNTHKKFIDPETILFHAGLKTGNILADFGAGSGHYAMAAAKIVGSNGAVHVLDIIDSALDHVAADARMRGYRTVKTYAADLESNFTSRIPEGSCDIVLLSNIMHEIRNHRMLLSNAYKLLKTGGRLLVVDWSAKHGPIGPAVEKRISEPAAKKTVESSGFRFSKALDADEYHFALVFEK